MRIQSSTLLFSILLGGLWACSSGSSGPANTGSNAGASGRDAPGSAGAGNESGRGSVVNSGGVPGSSGAFGSGGATGVSGSAAVAGGTSAQAGASAGGRSGSSGAAGTGPGSGGSASGAGGAAGGGRSGSGGSAGNGTGGAGSVPTARLWIAGDSTVQTYAAGNTDGNNGTPLEGWGQEIGQFFKSQLTVMNEAIGGRSVAFFMWSVVRDAAGVYQCVDTQGNPQYQLDAAGNHVDTSQWAQIKSGIRAGDFLLIQFGTNDETHDCPRFVSLADFETDLGIMADTVRAKGATPIFVTPMSHRSFVGTTVNNTLLPYANAMKTEATLKSVEVVDLNLRSVEYFQMVGTTFLATNIFDGGTTHFITAGAIKMAELITGEVRKNQGPLALYLK